MTILKRDDLVYPDLSYKIIGCAFEVVEIKSLAKFTKRHYDQVLNYLNTSGIKLALLITFGNEEVKCKRVVNFKAIRHDSKIRNN